MELYGDVEIRQNHSGAVGEPQECFSGDPTMPSPLCVDPSETPSPSS